MRFRVAVKKEAKNARSSRTNKFRKTKQNARLKILLISSRAFSSYIKFGGFGRINFFIFSLPFGRFLMCQYSKTRRYLFSTTVFACSRRLIGGFIFASFFDELFRRICQQQCLSQKGRKAALPGSPYESPGIWC